MTEIEYDRCSLAKRRDFIDNWSDTGWGLDAPPGGAGRTVLVFGASGRVGRAVVERYHELGWLVIACVRSRRRNFNPDVMVRLGIDARNEHLVKGVFEGAGTIDVVVSCIAPTGSNAGMRGPTFEVDWLANRNIWCQCIKAGVARFMYVSGVCQERPLLWNQIHKALFEGLMCRTPRPCPSWTVIRPTAYFYSFGASKGSATMLLGDGRYGLYNPISGRDLADFLVRSSTTDDYRDRVVPIGGPATPTNLVTMRDIADWRGKGARSVPLWLWRFIEGVLALAVSTVGTGGTTERIYEVLRIARYYTTHDMLAPAYGSDVIMEYINEEAKSGDAPPDDSWKGRVMRFLGLVT